MFEASLVDDTARTARPYTVSLSIVLQVMASAFAVAYPLWHIEKLPFLPLRAPSPFRNPTTLVDPRPAQQQTRSKPSREHRVFVLPTVQVRNNAPVLNFDLSNNLPPNDGITGPSVHWAASSSQPLGNGAIIVDKPVARPTPTPEVKPAAVPTGPLRVGGRVRPPELIHDVRPAYPALAKQIRAQGVVKIEAIISRDGIVRDARVVSGYPLLVAAALDAVRQWRYRPTVLNDQPVEVALALEVNFILAR